MKIMIRYEKIEDNIGLVRALSYNVENENIEDVNIMILEIDEMPKKDFEAIKNRKSEYLLINLDSKEMWYEYSESTVLENAKQQQQQIDQLTLLILQQQAELELLRNGGAE